MRQSVRESVRQSTRRASRRPAAATSGGVTQLRLLPGRTGRRDWALDERTRTVGRVGIAEARAILRRHRPPQPVDEYTKAS